MYGYNFWYEFITALILVGISMILIHFAVKREQFKRMEMKRSIARNKRRARR